MWASIFPGQGSQSIGMGRYLFKDFHSTRMLFEEASDLLSLNFKKLCFEGSEEELQRTENSQTVILLVSVATYEVAKKEFNFSFDFSAGHSVGEYAALVTSGVLELKSALTTVRKRGIFMQEAVPLGEGGMLAVQGLLGDEAIQLCEWAQNTSHLKPIEPAAFNAPKQTVLSGSSELTLWVQENINEFPLLKSKPLESKSLRFRLVPLKVSAPFHCSLMKPAEEKMRPVLNALQFKDAEKPIVQNVSAKPSSKAHELRENLISQITQPVQWVKSIETLKSLGVECFVEFGNSRILSGLLKKICNQKIVSYNTHSSEDFKTFERAWVSQKNA